MRQNTGNLDNALSGTLPEAEYTPLVARLRTLAAKTKYRHSEADEAMTEAADEIERLDRIYASACVEVVKAGVPGFGTLNEGIRKLRALRNAPAK